MYAWLKEFKKTVEVFAVQEEVKRLQAELCKVTEGRDILKKAAEETAMTVRWLKSFFQLFKRERIRRRTIYTRNQTREEIFDYIEVFYNRKRRPSFTNGVLPVGFEKQFLNWTTPPIVDNSRLISRKNVNSGVPVSIF